MRKYLRAIARANMQRQGFRKLNKKRRDQYGRVLLSLYASRWKEYIALPQDIKKRITKEREQLERKKSERNARRAARRAS